MATLRRGWRVCDLGTGSGALLLLLARRAPGLILSAIERDPLAAQTARAYDSFVNAAEGEESHEQ